MTSVTGADFSKRFPHLAASLNEAELAALLDALELREAAAGEALVAQGTPSGDLFLVWDGELDIASGGVSGARALAKLGPGSIFGDIALLDPGPAGASVVTEQGATTLR